MDMENKEMVDIIMQEDIILDHEDDVHSCIDMMITILYEARVSLTQKFSEAEINEKIFLIENQYLGAIDKGLRLLRKYFKDYVDLMRAEEYANNLAEDSD